MRTKSVTYTRVAPHDQRSTGGILRNSDKGEFLMETPQQVMYAFYAVLMLAAAGIAS